MISETEGRPPQRQIRQYSENDRNYRKESGSKEENRRRPEMALRFSSFRFPEENIFKMCITSPIGLSSVSARISEISAAGFLYPKNLLISASAFSGESEPWMRLCVVSCA